MGETMRECLAPGSAIPPESCGCAVCWPRFHPDAVPEVQAEIVDRLTQQLEITGVMRPSEAMTRATAMVAALLAAHTGSWPMSPLRHWM